MKGLDILNYTSEVIYLLYLIAKFCEMRIPPKIL